MSNNQAPNLSTIAQDDWDDSGVELDALLATETQNMINAENNKNAGSNMPQMREGGSTDMGLSVKMPAHLQGGQTNQNNNASQYTYKPTSNQGQFNPSQPSGVQQVQYQPQAPGTGNNIITETDIRDKEMQSALDNVGTGTDEDNTSLSSQLFKDSGTQSPQQSSNQQPNNNPQQPNTGNNNEAEKDPYILAFEIANTLGALTIPEDVDLTKMDKATLQKIADHTTKMQRYDAMNFIRQQASKDADTLRMLEYGMGGVPFSDIPKMQNIIQEKRDFTNFNIEEESRQKAIIELYLGDGLNPNDPRDQFVIEESIPAQIEKFKDEGQLKTKAQEAKTFFINRAEAEAQEEEKRTLALKEQQRYQEAQDRQAQEKYQNAFFTALNSSGWADEIKEAVKQQTGLVKLQDGTTMPLWQYKQNIILDNPKLFPIFLDFMTKFDHMTGNFNVDAQQEQPKDAIAALLNNMNNKQNNNSVSTVGNSKPNDPNTPAQPRVVDVNKSWF